MDTALRLKMEVIFPSKHLYQLTNLHDVTTYETNITQIEGTEENVCVRTG